MLARWIATTCRSIAALFRSVAAGLELLADEYNASGLPPSVEPTPAPIELAASVTRPGCLLPMDRLEDELTIRNALERALRSHLPDEVPAQACEEEPSRCG